MMDQQIASRLRAELFMLHAPSVYNFRERDDLLFANLSDSNNAGAARSPREPAPRYAPGEPRIRRRGHRHSHSCHAGRRRELDLNTHTPRNALLRSPHCLGERGSTVLIGRWRTLQHITASPGKIGRHRSRRARTHRFRLRLYQMKTVEITSMFYY